MKKEKIESIEDVRKKELRSIEKRLQELINFKDGKNEDGTNNYDARDDYRALPQIARLAIKHEINALNMRRKHLQYDIETIKKDFNDAIMNVLKYYGVEDKLPEIRDNFNRFKERDQFDTLIEDLAKYTSRVVDWKSKEKEYWY